MHVFTKDVQVVFSELSKTLYHAIFINPRPVNPLLSIIDDIQAKKLYSYLQAACKSSSMQTLEISNPVCRFVALGYSNYIRTSFQMASWKSRLNFEMIVCNSTVYFNINSDFTRVHCTMRLVAGLVIMMWKHNLVNRKEVTDIKLVIGSPVPLLYIHKLNIDSISKLLVHFLRKRLVAEDRNISLHLLNCI